MSAQVTPELIKNLRERTGIGVGKCKEALEEAKGDIELAIANLRKAGMASAVKKEGRETKEGMIGVGESPQAIALVEINAETDFVVRNELFQKFLAAIAQEIAATRPASLEAFMQQKYSKDPQMTIDQYRSTVIQAIGENIQIRRLLLLPKSSDKSLGVYSHLGGKIVTMVEISGTNGEEQLAKDIAMHVAAASPEYLSPEKVPESILANERDIAKSQIKDKPANIIDKIIEGKMKAFYDANCLLLQHYIRNDQQTITELVNQRAKAVNKPLVVTNFLRWNLGQ
jgi:elongation factor Ts